DRAARGDGGERVVDVVPARHRQLEAHAFDLEAAARRRQRYVSGAHGGARTGPENDRPGGEGLEVRVLADHQALAGARTEGREHRRDLVHFLVVALQVEDHADRGLITHQRAVTLVRLDYQQVGPSRPRVAPQALAFECDQIA